jgi:hypothetical protein
MSSPDETWAIISDHFHFASDDLARPHSSPLTRQIISRSGSDPISLLVTMHGPRAFAKSLPFAGPSHALISRAWMSRAEKSLRMVNPKMYLPASSMDTSRPRLPTTIASSSSKSTRLV